MQLETFRGPDLAFVVKQVRHALGTDAMIVRSDRVHNGSIELVEVLAARPEDIDAFTKKLDGGRAAALRAKDRRRVGPYTVAFVGPAGGGKTTTAIKVALSPAGVAGRRIGLITLDTHRVGGIEELQTYAEITRLPLEVLYSPADVPDALTRLAGMDVILVDTPGRAPGGDEHSWNTTLGALDPDEVHLVLPAGVRIDVARSMASRLAGTGPTHVLLTKLDEVPAHRGVVELVESIDLPTRWVADGPDIPGALGSAPERVLAALGMPARETSAAVRRAG